MGPGAGLTVWSRENVVHYQDSNSDPPVVHPTASRYTYCATVAPKNNLRDCSADLLSRGLHFIMLCCYYVAYETIDIFGCICYSWERALNVSQDLQFDSVL
jgi:hypothetical protein